MAFSKASYQHSTLSLREFEGARARTAEINGCQMCQNFRAHRDLPDYLTAFGGNLETSVASRGRLQTKRTTETFPIGAISALQRTRTARHRLCRRARGRSAWVAADEALWKRIRAAFSDEEIVDLSYCIACWMGLGRVGHALGTDKVVCSIVPTEQVA